MIANKAPQAKHNALQKKLVNTIKDILAFWEEQQIGPQTRKTRAELIGAATLLLKSDMDLAISENLQTIKAIQKMADKEI